MFEEMDIIIEDFLSEAEKFIDEQKEIHSL